VVLGEVDNPRVARTVTFVGITRSPIIDFFRADKGKCDQRRTAQARRGQKNCAVAEIRAGDAHQGGRDRVTASRITEIATGANRHGAAADQTKAYAGDRRGNDAAGQALQQRRDEDHDKRRCDREDQRGRARREDAGCQQAAFPRDGVDERSPRDLPDESGDTARGQN